VGRNSPTAVLLMGVISWLRATQRVRNFDTEDGWAGKALPLARERLELPEGWGIALIETAIWEP
jgi:hypothetical protein